MPDIDGIEVASVIRQEYMEKPPVIIMMASGSLNNLQSLGMAVGINLYLEKPVNSETLIEAIVGDSLHVLEKSRPQENSPHAPNFSALHILLVEDNSVNRKVAIAYLKNTNAIVTVVENGRLAVEKLTHDTSIDLVLMDIQMPVMDGFTATKIIRDDLKLTLPIIAMTAHAMVTEVNKSLEIGMNAHIAKPIDANLLYTAIQNETTKNEASRKKQQLSSATSSDKTKDEVRAAVSAIDGSLVIIDQAQAITNLLNDENAYQDILNDFLSMCRNHEMPVNIYSTEDLLSIQRIVHTISPALAYIGAFNLAEYVVRLEQELKQIQLPLDSIEEHKVNTFKSSLAHVVNKLTIP
jgi:CheY-like chemotaxis protein/HPt (histidine-containing phosphotransfer) domain-containing protein